MQRFVNIFKADAKVALSEFDSEKQSRLEELDELKDNLKLEIDSLKSQIANLETEKENLKSQISSTKSFHKSIFEGDDNGVIISNDIEGFVDEFKNHKKEIIDIKSDIDNYRDEIFGTEDEDGNEIQGLEHKIESLKSGLQTAIKNTKNEVDNFVAEHKTHQEDLFKKIESLLKGASTVALAKAFNEHKESFNRTNNIWLGLFVFSIISIMGISAWGFVRAEYEFKDMWKYTVGNLPFLAGAVWLAIYSSKQRSQNKRLQQEYAYKEDIAKVYYGLKEEIKELPDSDNQVELKEKMLKLVLDVIGQNPSETLESSSHDDKGPTIDVLNAVKDVVVKK
ncbi:MAG TPA: hypothetical protein EYO76_03815 [Flavobacteriaceae bacterium]|nr:hypothetical protein [Flavobacteriaceae bacterium]